jgi:hypothetical protein
VIAMFLAQRHPEAHLTVWDWSERALELGRKWAAERKISNIDFRHASYDDLAKEAVPDCDLVLMLYAIDLDPGETRPEYFPSQDSYARLLATPPPGDYLSASRAMFNLLKPGGVGAICGNWTEPGSLWLFESLRRASLTIDWDTSFTKGKVEDNKFITKLGYAFVRKDLEPITRDPVEDTHGFFASGEIDRHKLVYSTGASGALVGLFEEGTVLAEVAGDWISGGSERCRLIHHRGLLLLEHSTTLGFRRTCLTSVASISQQLQKIVHLHNQWKLAQEFKIGEFKLHQSIQRFAVAPQAKAF